MFDIVYIIKSNADPEELRYSLRSVCKNFQYNKVWIYGNCPNGIFPDQFVEIDQKGNTPWAKVSYTLKRIFENDEITKDFWLFNDDFFIIKPFRLETENSYRTYINGTIFKHIEEIIKRNKGRSKYTEQLRAVRRLLEVKGFDTLNYAMHIPILINRQKGIETMEEFPDVPMFRCLYGNMHRIPAILHEDVKIADTTSIPKEEWIFTSTLDGSFKTGNVGKYIRDMFPEKCKYESIL